MLDRIASSTSSRRPVATRNQINKRSSGPIDKAIGNSIRLARLQRGLSQTELGDILGVTFQQIQKYENGANRVATARLLQIAAAFGIPFVDLIGEADSVRKTGKPSADLTLLATCAPARRVVEAMRVLSGAGRDPVITKLAALAEELARPT